MQFKKIFSLFVLLMGLVSFAAAQDINISTPSSTTVNPTFSVAASSSTCSGVPTVSMGYSLDTNSNSTVVYATSLSASATTSEGSHQLHIKCWGKGTANVVTLDIDVVKPVTGAPIPDNAVVYKEIQQESGWRIKHDPATGGSASGTISLVGSPSLSGESAKFVTTYSKYGGVLYSKTYTQHEPGFTHFVYEAYVWIKSGSVIGNLEMDNNQVLSNGTTVIYGFQCAGNSGYWEYTDKENGHSHWLKSNQPCNPAKWAKDVWHHIQIATHRDSVGNVTYETVYLDGVAQPINKTVNADLSLGWASVLIGNFQVDAGSVGGSSTLYLDHFNIYAW